MDKAEAMPKGAIPPQQGIRAVRKSPGAIFGDYRPADLRLGPKPSVFSSEGLKERWQVAKQAVSSTMSVMHIKKQEIPFVAVDFAKEGQASVIQMYKAMAGGQKEELRGLVTPDLFFQLRASTKSGFKTFEGEVERPKVEFVQAIGDPNDKDHQVFQVTVRIHVKIATDGGEAVPTVSFPVFERVCIKGKDLGEWVICGFLESAQSKLAPLASGLLKKSR